MTIQDYRLTDMVLSESLATEWSRLHAAKGNKLVRFNQDKFGMFIHWGLYSLTSGEWQGNRVTGLGEWIMYHANIPRDDYAQLANRFNPDHFDPVEWVSLAKTAGMKYLVITAKHHDGFALCSSQHGDFNIADATPCNFEPLDLLYAECQRQGIGFGLYYSHLIDWWDGWSGEGGTPDEPPESRDYHKGNPMNTWDPSGNSREQYLAKKAYPQLQELLDRYPDLYLIWFDYWYKGKYINPPESFRFYQRVSQAQPDCLVNSRVAHDLGDYITAGDNVILESGQAKQWETPGTLNNTWGYSKYDDDWKGELELIYWLVNIVSRGGNYLLNIGPKPDGSIPAGATTGLAAIGRWMAVNSEAVYGTSAWRVTHEGTADALMEGTHQREDEGFNTIITAQDFWFTAKDDTVYAIALAWPEDGNVHIGSISTERVGQIESVSLLGHGELTGWQIGEAGLRLSLPAVKRATLGFVLKIS